jgi:hypothetical protein
MRLPRSGKRPACDVVADLTEHGWLAGDPAFYDAGGLIMDPDGISVLEAPSGQGTGETHTKEQILLSKLGNGRQ